MENSGGIQASLAGRYALALFELARDSKQLDSVGQSLAAVKAALEQSPDFKALTTSPLVGRDAAAAAVKAVSESLKIDRLTQNFLGVLAENRRLATRHNVSIHASFAAENATVETSITNLSLGGAQLAVTKRYTMGHRTTVAFELPTSETPIEVGVTVRWSDGKHIGVQFDGLRARDVWALNEYFKQLQG